MKKETKQTATTSYSAQYKDPRWQKKRLEILERDGFACQNCGDTESTLHVHHSHYENGNKVWEYENFQLTTLCETCHATRHQKLDALKWFIGNFQQNGCNEVFEIAYSIMELIYNESVDGATLRFLKSFEAMHKEKQTEIYELQESE